MSIAGDKDSLYSSEKMRAELLLNVASEYNKLHPSSKIEFTKAEVDKLSKINMFGVNIAAMKQWLGMTQEKMDEYIDPSKNPNAGIPIDMNENLEKPNEFQMWMRAAYNTSDENLTTAIKTGEGIAIKADKSTPYTKIQVVMDNLQTLKMNKFSLMTSLNIEDE